MAFKQTPTDSRLDIIVLGPMSDPKDHSASMNIIGDALRSLFGRPQFMELMEANGIGVDDYTIHLPHDWDEQEIIRGILSRVDIADLVIINLTPKAGQGGEPSPNVYYELGLVHALGLPVILLYEEGTKLPFYMLTSRTYRVKEFTVEAVEDCLSRPLGKFLDPEDLTDFTDNRVTQFYEGLPIVDISAAVGLATGYYFNFVGRILREGSFITTYPDKIRHLIIVRPNNIMNTYEEDHKQLVETLARAGLTTKTEQLPEPGLDKKGSAWIEHVDGIVFDLPRMIYPLKISPRLLSLRERLDKGSGRYSGHAVKEELLKRTSERLLDRVEQIILYYVRRERDGYRSHLLHFCGIADLPVLIGRLREGNSY
jgi:nucleoside 2-deoxyribosyltransferase